MALQKQQQNKGNISEWQEIKYWIELSPEIVGSSVGSVIGFVVGGVAGAFSGGALIPIITSILKDFGSRQLSHKEKVKIGGFVVFALEKIKQNLEQGIPLRQDSFFQAQITERAAAEEIFEGVIIASQQEHEEKKLRFYGRLFANIAFAKEISKEQANHILRLGQEISYRQMCLLNLVQNKEYFQLRKDDYIPKDGSGEYLRDENKKIHPPKMSSEEIYLLSEINNLRIKRILSFEEQLILGKNIGSLEYIKPDTLELEPIGKELYKLMDLHEIPEEDVNKIAQLLSEKSD